MHWQPPLTVLLWAALLACTGLDATAQIRTDASLGQTPQTLQGPAYVLPELLGKRVGHNLFHSFGQFNIGSDESATFLTHSDGIRNVISRVTGGSMSQIHGTLALRAHSGTPAFYFLNPAGIVFGHGATVDVPGALHISTADGLRFPEGVWLAHTAGSTSVFSSADPVDFGFLGPGRGPVHIGQGTMLHPATGQPLSVVGNDITLDGSLLSSSEGGAIRVSAAGKLSVLRGSKIISYTSSPAQAGDTTIEAAALSIDGPDPGTVTGITSLAVTGIPDLAGLSQFIDRMDTDRYITAITDISGLSGYSATGNTGHVRVHVAGPLQLRHGAIASSTFTAGDTGSVQIDAGSLSMDQLSTILSDSFPGSTGRAGSVQVQVHDTMTVSNNSMVSSNTQGTGSGGDVRLHVGERLALRNGGFISSVTLGSGHAGTVQVEAGSLSMEGGNAKSFISSDTSDGSGNAGTVQVQVRGAMTVSDGSMVSSNTQGAGRGGDVHLHVEEQLALRNGGLISSVTLGSGKAGTVQVQAGSLSMEQGSAILSDSWLGSTGPAGSVQVQVGGAMAVSDGSMVSSNTQGTGNGGDVQLDIRDQLTVSNGGFVGSATLGAGHAGTVQIKAGSLSVDGAHAAAAMIYSGTGPGSTGQAGSVQVQVRDTMTIHNGGVISTTTLGDGAAGDVRVAAGNLRIAGGDDQFAVISSDTVSGSGHAGTVQVAVAGALELLGGGVISSSTATAGAAGAVAVSATEIRMDGVDSRILGIAKAHSSGQTGTLDLQAHQHLTLTNGSSISIRNDATVVNPTQIVPSALHIRAPVVQLTDSQITAAASGNVDASNLSVSFKDRLQLDNSQITTSASLGNGGAIQLLGGQRLGLHNSQITTSVLGALGNGGDIAVRSQALALHTGAIQANTAARHASGGRVQVDVQTLLPSAGALWLGGNTPYALVPGLFGFNVIQAAAPTGINGHVNITVPALDLSSALQGLGAPLLDSARLGHNPCDTRNGSTLAVAGRGHYPVAHYGWLGLLPTAAWAEPDRVKADPCPRP
ncbi:MULTISPECIES: two-partner secretion domain-containing protein [Giesbergeria]|uniref:Filamentous hemagglutinin N-terminal domain-containing protein n=1 Tax=Giesbergeria sinuosa TaxID=80883 RepID=A0ABV9Q9Y3_9BURK